MKPEQLIIKHVLPALPGFFSLSLIYDEENRISGAYKEPVIGWVIDQYGIVCPVTPDTIEGDALATLRPDGVVQSPLGYWDSMDAWLAEQQARG